MENKVSLMHTHLLVNEIKDVMKAKLKKETYDRGQDTDKTIEFSNNFTHQLVHFFGETAD